MNYLQLYKQIIVKNSYLCIGLDTDLSKVPIHLLKEKDPIFEFNKQIIDATADYCVAFKPNTAFYECNGSKGWESLQKTIEYIPKDTLSIIDAKRGDIGNTSDMYAKAFFETMHADAVTLSPYMGRDSALPYLEYQDKWAIILALTSNESSQDFEELIIHRKSGGFDEETVSHKKLFEIVIEKAKDWGTIDQIMFVVGATKCKELENIRKVIPAHFLLIPGVGSQGGDLEHVSKYGLNKHVGLLVNNSRAIIYADNTEEFANKAAFQAKNIQQQMEKLLQKYT